MWLWDCIREAAETISHHDVPPHLREYIPPNFFYLKGFTFKPLPPSLQSTWIVWKDAYGSIGGNFLHVDFLWELDFIPFLVGGTAMFVYSYIAGDISFGFRGFQWPPPRNLIEGVIPIERVHTHLCSRLIISGRYAGRFLEGAGVYTIFRYATYIFLRNRLTPFRTSHLTSTIFALYYLNRYSFQRRVWKIVNGLWTGLAMAYFEDAIAVWFHAVNDLSPADMPFR